MIFNTLKITNFQSHANTEISFVAGLNVIVGPSNTGKSAIVRALRKLIRDDPPGKTFIRQGQTECVISLIIEKNNATCEIVRKITASKNLYYLNDFEFGGFGREIPQEIQDTLEMFLIVLENSDKVDLHFADQHDTPFMVTKGSAGTRSKLIGRIGGLHVLDRAIVFINKDIRTENSTLKSKLITKEIIQQKVNVFTDLKVPERLLTRLQTDLDEIIQQMALKSILEQEYDQLKAIAIAGKEANILVTSLPEIQIDANAIRLKLRRFEELIRLQQQLQQVESELHQITVTTPDEIVVNFNSVIENQKILFELLNLQDNYNDICNQIVHTEAQHTENANTLIILKQKWVDTLKQLKICPTCKQSTEHMENFNV